MKPTSRNKPLTTKQYEELGKIVASVYETGYLNAAKSYKMAFFKGVVQGFGGVIGATLVVGILLWLLSLLDAVPFLGDVLDNLQNSFDKNG